MTISKMLFILVVFCRISNVYGSGRNAFDNNGNKMACAQTIDTIAQQSIEKNSSKTLVRHLNKNQRIKNKIKKTGETAVNVETIDRKVKKIEAKVEKVEDEIRKVESGA